MLGALRDEIVLAARTVGVLDCFQIIVDAKDVTHGKPDPEGYLLARSQTCTGDRQRHPRRDNAWLSKTPRPGSTPHTPPE